MLLFNILRLRSYGYINVDLFHVLFQYLQVHHGSLYVNGIAQTEDFLVEGPAYTSNLTVRFITLTFLCFCNVACLASIFQG